MAHTSRRKRQILMTSLALLLTSLFQGSVGRLASAGLSQQSCCSVLSGRHSSGNIACSCPHLDKLKLGPGDFPPGVLEVSISGPSSFTIQRDAIYNVTSLRNFTLHDIGRVSVESYGLNLQSKSRLVYLTIRGVQHLHIDSHALTGKWREGAATWVTFEDVKRLEIERRGLSYATSADGPNVNIRNIHSLQVASEAFDARIRTLLLKNVTMDACHWGTFSNKIDSVELSDVTIPNVKTRCFHSVGEFGKALDSGVFVRSSTLSSVQAQAFSGNIPYLELTQDTVLGEVAERGFQLNVKDFKIEKSKINTLNSNGLSVTCRETFSVADVNIKRLHKNAFRAVKAMSTGTVVSLKDLQVEIADPGSFSLPPCLNMRATGLHIQSADIERCPADRWARRLMGLGEHQSPSKDEYELYLTLSELLGSCVPSLEPPPVMPVQDKSCSASRDENEAKEAKAKQEKGGKKEKNGQEAGGQLRKHTEKAESERNQQSIVHEDVEKDVAANDKSEANASNEDNEYRSHQEKQEDSNAQVWFDASSREARSKEEENDDSSSGSAVLSKERKAEVPKKTRHAQPQLAMKTDPHDVSYEYDEYWSEDDEVGLHTERPRRNTAQRTSASKRKSSKNPWMLASIALMSVSVVLLASGFILRWRSRNGNKSVTTSAEKVQKWTVHERGTKVGY